MVKISRRRLIRGAAASFIAHPAIIRPASAWPVHGKLSPPPWAAAAGFNTLVFNDDFTSLATIDGANTGNPGFNWYLQHAWPNAAGDPTNPDLINWQSNTPQDIANMAIGTWSGAPANSVLITNATPPNTNPVNAISMSSACLKGSAPGYTGNVFGGGGGFEVRMNWTGTLGFGDLGPWMFPIEWFTGSLFTPVELDIMETGNSATTHGEGYIYDWTPPTEIFNPPFAGNANIPNPDGNFHTYGFLWRTRAQTGGNGTFTWYLDSVHQSQNDVSYGSSFTMGGATTTGALVDASHFVMMLLSKGSVQSAIDWWRVWQ